MEAVLVTHSPRSSGLVVLWLLAIVRPRTKALPCYRAMNTPISIANHGASIELAGSKKPFVIGGEIGDVDPTMSPALLIAMPKQCLLGGVPWSIKTPAFRLTTCLKNGRETKC
jgi:hypothetical protein